MHVSAAESHFNLPEQIACRFDAAFFDLDGTLIDSEPHYADGLHRVLTNYGVELTREESTQIVYGRSWHEIYECMQTLAPHRFSSSTDLALQIERDLTLNNIVSTPVLASIKRLRQLSRQMPTAVVSGSSRRRVLIELRRMLPSNGSTLAIGYEDYPRGKPAPDGFLLAANLLNVEPERCIVFEDSSVGVKSARNAGMSCIALSRDGESDQDVSEANLIVESLGDEEVESFLTSVM